MFIRLEQRYDLVVLLLLYLCRIVLRPENVYGKAGFVFCLILDESIALYMLPQTSSLRLKLCCP